MGLGLMGFKVRVYGFRVSMGFGFRGLRFRDYGFRAYDFHGLAI